VSLGALNAWGACVRPLNAMQRVRGRLHGVVLLAMSIFIVVTERVVPGLARSLPLQHMPN
jgi:hypothetical protein